LSRSAQNFSVSPPVKMRLLEQGWEVWVNLSYYSMGFLELFAPGRVELRGSGTLVRIGKTSGILTAAHVWRTIRELPTVGLYLYPPRKLEVQSIREDPRLMDAVTFENDSDDALGPDIAFIRLTPSKAASVEKHAAFLSLEKDEHRALVGGPAECVTRDIVVGGVEALGQKINIYEEKQLVIQNSLANVGFATAIDDGREGFDRLEFTPEPVPDYVFPDSYGGMSGGGCFRVYFPRVEGSDNQPISFHLLGVAFFQTKLDGKAHTIICHGRRSLMDKLLPAVRAKWPNDG